MPASALRLHTLRLAAVPAAVCVTVGSLGGDLTPAVLDAAGLSADERARLDAFSHADRRRGFVLGRAAARALLAERLGVAPADVPLGVAGDGSPTVGDAPGVFVSIAHAGRGERAVGVAAVADGAVGVDAEPIRPRRPDLWRRILRPDEHALLDRLGGPTDRAQTLLWSLKEAVLKGQRTGLRAGARSVRLSLGDDGETGSAVADASGAWRLAWTDAGGMWISVAWADGAMARA
jgi:4'-phosphopantetheinyl transferase